MIRQKPMQVRKLEYRSPRLASAISVALEMNGILIRGYSTDISESGICARFGQEIPVGATGLLSLHHRDGPLTRRARVAYIEGRTVGLSFLPDQPQEGPHTIALVVKPSPTG